MDTNKLTKRAIFVQGASSFAIALLTMLTGFVFAWPSYNVAGFMSNETVLNEPMNSVHVSLLGSLTNIGALTITPFCGYIMNTFGRKYSAMFFGLPYVLSWTIISVSSSIPLILIAMAIAGVGAAGQAVSTIYISEISHDSIRGATTSTIVSGYFFGLLLSYTMGGLLSFNQTVYVHLTLSVVYILLVAALKESPVYLIQKGKEKEAAESIAFYRQISSSSKEVEVEIANIKMQLDPKLDKMLEESDEIATTKELLEKPSTEEKLSEWQFLKKSESSIRALITCLVCMSTMILMGNIALQVFAETLFKEAVPSMDSNQCSILLAMDLLAASIVCMLLIDRCGRKPLMVITSAVSGVCTLILGLQIHFHWAPHWFTAVLIYVYCFIFNVGVAVIPYVLTAELFLPEVRGLCGSLVMSVGWILNFITVLAVNPVVESFGFAPLFYAFTAVSFIGSVYCVYYLPETNGMSVDAIQALFMKKNRRRNHV